jgi:hypothetical protein
MGHYFFISTSVCHLLCVSVMVLAQNHSFYRKSAPRVIPEKRAYAPRPDFLVPDLMVQESDDLLAQISRLEARIEELERNRPLLLSPRDPFAAFAPSPPPPPDTVKALPKKKLIAARKIQPRPVKVEELESSADPSPPIQVTVRPAAETVKPTTVKFGKENFSLKGLNAKQRKLLIILAKIPEYPTEYIHGTRFVRIKQKRYRDDCSNVLRIAYDAIGIDLFSEHHLYPSANGVKLIRKKGETEFASTSSTSAKVGDIIVFDNTFDRNGNGRFDDRDTHAAIVVGVDKDGTIALYNRVASGHRVYRMNLRYKDQLRSPRNAHRINNVLRRVRKSKRKTTPRLTGELFASYVSVI